MRFMAGVHAVMCMIDSDTRIIFKKKDIDHLFCDIIIVTVSRTHGSLDSKKKLIVIIYNYLQF